jgi:hypothetical protein
MLRPVVPIFLLPKWLQHLAPWLPTYHLSQLAEMH